MTIKELLHDFYQENKIPDQGGYDKKQFQMKAFGLSFMLPNPKFRREVIHIHDIQHVLNKQDTSWKGEGFIAGWEISTGMWKHFPLGFLSLWAMGYSLWLYPKAVYDGYIKGLGDHGIIDLSYTREAFMEMKFDKLKLLTKKNQSPAVGLETKLAFFLWFSLSQILFLSPALFALLFVLFLW